MSAPKMKNSPLFHHLRMGEADKFNRGRMAGEKPDLEDSDLRGSDMRGANLDGVSLKGAYLRSADMRGLDLRNTNLEGASLRDAKVSGVYFPASIPAQEIIMSLTYGTRIRITTPEKK